ncbi:MAG TPA: glycosyltransferase family 4 protein [Methylomirabilota bacterium]|nr:glycosyltransferase family 4 protein [Methylomirabilota bacterium]
MTDIPILEVLVSTQAGGGPQHVLTLAGGLRARGWRLLVAGPADGTLFARFREVGVEPVELRTDRLSPLTLLRLVRLVRASGARIVHSHGKGAGLHARLAARLTGVPAVHTLHGIHYERYAPPARAAYLALERRLSTCTRVVINVSRAQEREGLALGLFTRSQSRVILNGVDVARLTARALDRWDARVELGLPQSAPVVGCAARLDEVKRLDLLLRAAARLPAPPAVVALIGRGPEQPRLRALAAELGLGSRVTFAGEIPEAARLFAAFDVFAAPSRKEGLPLAVVEAMALGLPVVASDIEAHREALGEASEGLVEGTPGAFADRLGAVLRDAALRGRLAAENRTRARSEFDVREMLAAVDGVYRAVLAL